MSTINGSILRDDISAKRVSDVVEALIEMSQHWERL